MNEKDFENLVESIKEAGKIKAGELAPSRRFEFLSTCYHLSFETFGRPK